MPHAAQRTRERILAVAAQEFLDKGFAKANLRDIARKSEVTTGAIYRHFPGKEELFQELLRPAFDVIAEARTIAAEEDAAHPAMHMLSEAAIQCSLDGVMQVIDAMYEQATAFKLLLCCADGSPYEDTVELIVDSYTDSYEAYVDHLVALGIATHRPGRMELHMLARAFIESICECVRHDIAPTAARDYLKSIVIFEHHGWYGLLGIGAERAGHSAA